MHLRVNTDLREVFITLSMPLGAVALEAMMSPRGKVMPMVRFDVTVKAGNE